jgi:cytochrome c peroxidase
VLFEATAYVIPSRFSRSLFLIAASAAFALTSCKRLDDVFCSGGGCEWSAEEWARIQTLSPLPDPPPDPSNQYVGNADAIKLGQEFYFDTRFSGNATLTDAIGQAVPYARPSGTEGIKISCATCHDPKRAGADFTSAPNTVSIGAGWYDVNSQQTVNAAYYPLLYWNGRTDSLWSQAAQVSESGVSMNGTRLNTFWQIYDDLHYREAYIALFGDAWPTVPTTAEFPRTGKPTQAAFDNMTPENKLAVTKVWVNFAKAIAAYEYTLISRNSAFDVFVAEGAASTAISPAAKRGARLFVGRASCIDCHNGPLFSDGGFHDIGVPQVGDHVPTVADCPTGSARCDCTRDDEKGTCLPAGAWAGLLKLSASVEPANGSINFNNTRRDSMWSDDPNDASRAAYYEPPTDTSLKGAWRTPSLRDAALTPPYMHDGYYRTLEEVVWHYNVGGAASGSGQFNKTPAHAVQVKPLGLRDDEQADLVEFLKTLTGAPQDPTKVVKPPAPDAGASPPLPDAGSPPDAGAADAASQ